MLFFLPLLSIVSHHPRFCVFCLLDKVFLFCFVLFSSRRHTHTHHTYRRHIHFAKENRMYVCAACCVGVSKTLSGRRSPLAPHFAHSNRPTTRHPQHTHHTQLWCLGRIRMADEQTTKSSMVRKKKKKGKKKTVPVARPAHGLHMEEGVWHFRRRGRRRKNREYGGCVGAGGVPLCVRIDLVTSYCATPTLSIPPISQSQKSTQCVAQQPPHTTTTSSQPFTIYTFGI